MKNLSLKLFGLFAIITFLFAFGCESESNGGTTPVNPLPPVISLESGTGGVTGDIVVDPSVIYKVTLNVGQGDNTLKSIAVLEDGFNLPVSRIISLSTGSTTITPNNPFLLAGDLSDGGLIDLELQAHDVEETRTITFEVTDNANKTDAVSFDLTVERSTTPLNTEFTAVIINNANGPNDGGLDLDNGTTVPRSSTDAEVRDLGIDTDLPVPSNWLQRIEPVNGASLRAPDLSMLDDFTFANTDNRERILEAWNTSTDLTASERLAVGDMLIVKRGEDYWLMIVTDIDVTESDNLDKYTFDVKGSKG